MLDARGGRDDRYGLYGIYKTSKKTEEMSREESVQHFLDLIKSRGVASSKSTSA